MLKKLAMLMVRILSTYYLILAGNIYAQQFDSTHTEPITPVSKQKEPASNWSYVFGVGGGYIPTYEGSDKYEAIPVPIIKVDYKNGMFFFNVRDGVGSYPLSGESYKVGVSIAYASERKESDDRKNLRGMGELKASATANILAEYDFGIIKLAGRITSAISGDYGTTALLSFSSHYPLTRKIILTGSVFTMWGDEEHMNNRFGVTDVQSSSSGNNLYMMKSGIKSVGSSIGLNYLVTNEWTVNLTVSSIKLMDEVIDSPVVKKDTLLASFLTISYRF